MSSRTILALTAALGLLSAGPVSALSYSVSIVNLAANDLVYDPFSQMIYASVPSTAGVGRGNSITPINPLTGAIGNSVFIGSEPGKLAISDNGQYIYAALDGAAAIRRFDVATQSAGLQFAVGQGSFGALFAEDIEVMPGQAGTVAVSRRNSCCSPRHEGVAIYDDGVMRATTTPGHTGSNRIEFAGSAGTLVGYNNETTDFGVRRMSVTAAGVQNSQVFSGVISGFGTDIDYANGVLYATTGRAIDPVSGLILGTYAGSGSVAPDVANGLVYFLNSNRGLSVFDLDTFLFMDSASVGDGATGSSGGLIRWGEAGLAFRTSASQVVLLNMAPVPAPPAVWLFGTAVASALGWSGRRRGRKASASPG